MPESRYRYLYERLGDHDFQQLVNAVLVFQFPDYVPMSLRQADGGRDGLRKIGPDRVLIYQHKWSVAGKEKDAVAWLDSAVRREAKALHRLAQEGVQRYTLVTNIPSTSKRRTGTFDRLNSKLGEYSNEFGFDEMNCIWREGIDAAITNMPLETKWSFAEMLAGWDLIRFLVAENAAGSRDRGTRDLLRKVAASQWNDDRRVKFSQSDVDRERVADLFVDVTADRLTPATAGSSSIYYRRPVGGAAQYLSRRTTGSTLVRGAPGQGKSTLGQYVCQIYRASFVDATHERGSLPEVEQPLFPIRLDLSDYARWLSGSVVWDSADESRTTAKKARTAEGATIELFLADLLSHESGGISVNASTVQEIFSRVPCVVVLDGLDEVGRPRVRASVVAAIDKFASRCSAYELPPKIVVTTRPSVGELPEPSNELFEILTLNQLEPKQREDYLRKWCAVRGIKGREGRTLRKGFKDKSREPYIGELAGNPMQLTILLDLLHEQGAAIPTQRTDLYDKYVDLLLAREANKHPDIVRKYKEELIEVVPFLGWYLHSHAEESQVDTRMSIAEIKAAMKHFQRAYGNREEIVDALFEGATDRLWALASKVDGTYEFEVLSLREYFAARFLYRNAGEENSTFDSTEVLRNLLRRPYWLNTVRFYGGSAKGNGIYMVTAGVEAELSENPTPAAIVASWFLLTDGVFFRRPREARKVLTALCSDRLTPTLVEALDRQEVSPLPQLPDLPESDGPDPTWSRLTSAIAADPSNESNTQRVRVLRELLGQRSRFADWWMTQFESAISGPLQTAWLRIAAEHEAAAGLTASFDPGTLVEGSAELILNTGAIAPTGSDLEEALIAAVLNGECPAVESIRSLPAQIAVSLSPARFYTSSTTGFVERNDRAKRRRTDAVSQLRHSGSVFDGVARERRFGPGQNGSTFPWSNTASALHAAVGRCWLASEIAIIGAASSLRLGYTRNPTADAFGINAHPAETLAQSRNSRWDPKWWRIQIDGGLDDLGRAEWVFALWAVADGQVLSTLLPDWEEVLNGLSAVRRRVVVRAAANLAGFGWLHNRPVSTEARTEDLAGLLSQRSQSGLDEDIRGMSPDATRGAVHESDSLLTVARSKQWLKVDALPAYR